MIEIINIIYLIVSLLLLCHFPLTNKSQLKFSYVLKVSNIENLCLNLSIFLNTLLIFSFFQINLNLIFIVLLILSIVNVFSSKTNFLSKEYFFLIFVTFIMSVYIASNIKLEWDGQVWIYKTINFYDGNNFSNLVNIPGIITYPHLGAFSWAFFWKNSFIDHEYTGRIFYIFCYTLAIILISVQNKKDVLSNFLIIFTFIILSSEFYLLGGYQEYLTFSLLVFIYYFINKFFLEKNKYLLIVALLFINAVIWIKNEAAIFVLFILFSCFIKSYLNDNKIKKEFFFIFFVFIVINIFKNYIFFESFGEINKGWPNYKTSNLSEIFDVIYLIDRVPYIIMHICIALIKNEVYILFFVVLIYKFLKKHNINIFIPYLIFLFFNILLVFTIYFLTDHSDWKTYISTTADRLFFQTSGVYLLLIYQVICDIYKKYI